MRAVACFAALVATLSLPPCTRASKNDLTSTWQITDSSRQHLPELFRQVAGQLSLSPDGTFTALELPIFVPQSPPNPFPTEPGPTLLTGGGTWKLGQTGGQHIKLYIETAAQSYTGLLPYGYPFSVYWGWRDYSLVDYWGDPDSVPGIFFERTEPRQEGHDQGAS